MTGFTATSDPESASEVGAKTPVRQAAAELCQQRRTSGRVCKHCGHAHPDGRAVTGCPGPGLRTGLHSALVRSGATTGQQDALARSRVELRTELGNVGIVKGSLADAFIELDAVRYYLGGRLAAEGPLTGKGRTKALLSAYLTVVDRQVRLAHELGVEPITKTMTLPEYLASAEGGTNVRDESVDNSASNGPGDHSGKRADEAARTPSAEG